MSIFDDGAQPQVEPQSRGLVIELSERARTARLVRRYTHHPRRIVTRFMGNLQMLPNGNVLVGWGSEPYVTEFGADGAVEFDARLPPGSENYRAFRFSWHGRPETRPAVAYRYRRGEGSLYVSWNGATEVAAWRLESGSRRAALRAQPTVPRRGFETRLPVPHGDRWGRAVALDAEGNELRRSLAIRV